MIKWMYQKFTSVMQVYKNDKKTIDVYSRNLNSDSGNMSKQEPLYLRKYIENRNTE